MKLKYLDLYIFNFGNKKNKRNMLVETLLNVEKFKKWSNNIGNTDIENYEPVLDAFTHFTYENTNGLLIVVDLQGEKRGDTFLLTDPVIHCIRSNMFGETNFQLKGIVAFFQTHECNDICRSMNLSVEDMK